VAALALGWLGLRARLPAACMLAGMALSGILHGAGIIEGLLPAPLVFSGFIVTGASVGARFSGIPKSELRQYAVAAVAIVTAAGIISAIFAAITARAIDVPFIQAWVAFAPGGIETMAAMALALGLDPGYVASHHVARILFLIAILPLVLRLAGVRNEKD
jgi:membrane AbrB-like protein